MDVLRKCRNRSRSPGFGKTYQGDRPRLTRSRKRISYLTQCARLCQLRARPLRAERQADGRLVGGIAAVNPNGPPTSASEAAYKVFIEAGKQADVVRLEAP